MDRQSILHQHAGSRMVKPVALAISLLATAMAGCNTTPKVSYSQITRQSPADGTEFDKFVLQDSVLVVDLKRDEKGAVSAPLQFTVSSLPVEYDSFKLAMYRRGGIGTRTNVVISKIENTEIPREVGSEVVDKRLELVKNIGSVLVGMVGFDSGSKTKPLPYRITTSPHIKGTDAHAPVSPANYPGGFIEFGAAPVDAVPRDQVDFKATTSNFYYSACRTAVVTVCTKKDSAEIFPAANASCVGGTANKLAQVKVADPSHIQSIGLPQKGKITMHSQCGVSVSTDKDSGVASNDALLAEIVSQLGKVKEATDKKE